VIGDYLLSLLVWLIVVCGLVVLTLWAWKRVQTRLPGNQGPRRIQVTETLMISPGLRLAVIEFEGRTLLVSVGRGGVTLVDKAEPGAGQRLG
jgi:flagellar protein FliO/FliZ